MDKAAWRARLVAGRRAVPRAVADAEAGLLAAAVAGAGWRGTVCGYLPMRTEPGDLAMLDALLRGGIRVLLPVIDGVGPLDWAPYEGAAALAPARFGVTEPMAPRLGARAVAAASAVLVPALAVDAAGVRLGKGGGFYDRTLPDAAPDCALVAVVRDDEVVAALPGEAHDVRMTHVLTPSGGLRRL